MASLFTIQQIITFAQISQYLAGNDIASKTALRSGSINENLPGLLYMEGYLLENMYTLNPGGSTLRKTAEYVLSLCGKYLSQAQNILNNLAAGPPVITGPANQSVNQGSNATFMVVVTSSLLYVGQWYDYLGNPIVGQTSNIYVFYNAQSGDSGKTFYFKATSVAGTTVSGMATLTVTANIIGYAYAGGADYSAALQGGTDAVPFQFTFPITTGQPLSVQFTGPVVDEFIVIKYPSTEPTKTGYNNPPIDAAGIPGFAFNATTITTWKYIFSRSGNAFTVNNSNLITFN